VQIYPENAVQAEMMVSAAMKVRENPMLLLQALPVAVAAGQ
jgi:hypothetical protein